MANIDHESHSGHSNLWFLLIPAAAVCAIAVFFAVIHFQGIPFMMVPG